MIALVVAPSAVTARMIEHLLIRGGCTSVQSCRNATDALARLTSSDEDPIQILVTEWDLPGRSGLDLIRELKAGSTGLPPTILFGTRNAREDVLVALESPVEAYLLKPIDPEEFVTRVKEIVVGQVGREAEASDAPSVAAATDEVAEAEAEPIDEAKAA